LTNKAWPALLKKPSAKIGRDYTIRENLSAISLANIEALAGELPEAVIFL
jgi:hypothetical protein